ncbi:hypothetical protein [Sphingomonas sp. SRS2]|uniref:hypothetical protein n=1 Tax=Sphingomonas sp. SRS2 TaxID=133190 RepID=UPI00061843F6|nr:hypothetical protein [Sphingomonas sp. SRS2]KKC27442.1 hypothetical protein WP12_03440 [Sphingomonas sp. SRS2]
MSAIPKCILGKKESVYATDPTPTAADNAVLTRNFASKAIELDVVERGLDLPHAGSTRGLHGNERKRNTFEIEIAGSGDVDTAPAWMEFLECCGMTAPDITPDTKVEQKMLAAGASVSSLAMYDWYNNQKRVGVGGRGTFGWDFTAGAVPFWSFDFQFLLPAANAIVQNSFSAPTLTRWAEPVLVNTANTDFTVDGHALTLRSFSGAANASVEVRNLVGGNYVKRANHAVTVRILAEAPDVSTKNYFSLLRSGAHVPVQLIHGTVAGNIVQFDSTHLEIVSIDINEEGEVPMIEINGKLNISVGQDDILITTK